jgi:L-lysine 2,3-aminomutase
MITTSVHPRQFEARTWQRELSEAITRTEELADEAGYVDDPVSERGAVRARGLLQKYCRYCFRREFPYAEQSGEAPRWREALAQIAADSSLEEIILSGGDLVLPRGSMRG